METASVGIEHLTYRMSLTSSIILKICIQVDLFWSGIGLVQLGSNEVRVVRSFFSLTFILPGVLDYKFIHEAFFFSQQDNQAPPHRALVQCLLEYRDDRVYPNTNQ